MNIATNIPVRFSYSANGDRSDLVWHSSLDLLASGFTGDMICSGISRDHIGYSIGDVASINKLEVYSTISSGLSPFSGELLLLS